MKIPELRWPHREGDYDGSLLLSIEAGVVAYLVRGRNAWHSTWVRHWFRNTHLFTSVGSAQLGAEPLRQRGNVFYAREIPALVLRGPHEAVVVCEVNSNDPFARFSGLDTEPVETPEGRWIDGIYPGVSLRDAVAAFGAGSGNWDGARKDDVSILTGVVPTDFTFMVRDGDFKSLKSYAEGSGYMLGWLPDPVPKRPATNGVETVTARWQVLANLALQGTVSARDLASSFAAYRDGILDAEPRSEWDVKIQEMKAAAAVAREVLREAWKDAQEQRAQVEHALRDAVQELKAASTARLRPADTSAGMRIQRQRVEEAEEALAGLQSDLAIVDAFERARRDEYIDTDRSLF